MIITPRCKPVPIPDNVIDVVNKIGEEERMPNRIYFCNIHTESTLDDLYGDIESQDDSSCTSDESWNMSKNGEIDLKNIVYNNAVDNDEINDLDNKDALNLNDSLVNNNNNNIKHIGVINQQNKQQDKRQNHFDVPNNNLQPQNNHFGGLGKPGSDADNDGENNNKHVHISDDDVSNTDYNGDGNNSNDS